MAWVPEPTSAGVYTTLQEATPGVPVAASRQESPKPNEPFESLENVTEPVGWLGVAAVLETVAVHVVVCPAARAAGEQPSAVDVDRLPANTYTAPCCPLLPSCSLGAPPAIVPLSTASAPPKPATESVGCVGVSFAVSLPSANTYAAPTETSWNGAPATTVSPDTATEAPSSSCAAASLPVSFAAWWPSAQPPPGLTNTYAAPSASRPEMSAPGAPAATVPPEIATEVPSPSLVAASDAVSTAASVPSAHPAPGFTKT